MKHGIVLPILAVLLAIVPGAAAPLLGETATGFVGVRDLSFAPFTEWSMDCPAVGVGFTHALLATAYSWADGEESAFLVSLSRFAHGGYRRIGRLRSGDQAVVYEGTTPGLSIWGRTGSRAGTLRLAVATWGDAVSCSVVFGGAPVAVETYEPAGATLVTAETLPSPIVYRRDDTVVSALGRSTHEADGYLISWLSLITGVTRVHGPEGQTHYGISDPSYSYVGPSLGNWHYSVEATADYAGGVYLWHLTTPA